MRPRISQIEAKFLLETLQKSKEDAQARLNRKNQLEYEIRQLWQQGKYGDPFTFIDKAKGFREKKEELQRLRTEYSSLCLSVTCYDSLLSKFQSIASGKTHHGRHKATATIHQWLLKGMEERNHNT